MGWRIRFVRGRARRRRCRAAHVLLPVTVPPRRAYAAERIWAALVARRWVRHRRAGAVIRVTAAAVGGGHACAAGAGLDALRAWLSVRAVTPGWMADPDRSGCPWWDAPAAAVEAATAAITSRFGAAGFARRGDAGLGGGRAAAAARWRPPPPARLLTAAAVGVAGGANSCPDSSMPPSRVTTGDGAACAVAAASSQSGVHHVVRRGRQATLTACRV